MINLMTRVLQFCVFIPRAVGITFLAYNCLIVHDIWHIASTASPSASSSSSASSSAAVSSTAGEIAPLPFPLGAPRAAAGVAKNLDAAKNLSAPVAVAVNATAETTTERKKKR
jgi:hypothetical protein